MAVADRLNKLSTDITNAYTSINSKGGTIPANKNTNNLPTAIDSIEVIEQATAEGESLSLTNTKAMPYKNYVVEGKSEQTTRSGKNLANDNDMLQGYWAYADGGFVYSNTWICTPKIACKGNVDYTFQFANNSRWYGFVWYDENNNFISTANQQNNLQTGFRSFTAKSPSNAGYLAINIAGYPGTNDTISTDDLIDFQLKESSTVTDYEPYGASPSPEYPSEIHSVADDVNLFDKNGENIADGYISASGYFAPEQGNIDETVYIKCKPNTTYTLQKMVQNTIAKNRFVVGTSTVSPTGQINVNILYRANEGSTITSQTVTTDSNANYLLFFCYNTDSNTSFEEMLNSIKISEFPTLTPYSPYNQGTVTIKQRGTTESDDYTFQTEPLRSLPNGVKDTIEADGVHRRVGRVVLDGSENNWAVYAQGFQYTYYISISDCKIGYQKSLCSHFKNSNQTWEPANGKVGQYSDHPTITNKYFNTDKSTLASWKEWLQQNPITLIYELEEEVIEPLTQNQATTMLDIIKTGSYEGTTNIYTDEDVKPTIGVDYYKKG